MPDLSVELSHRLHHPPAPPFALRASFHGRGRVAALFGPSGSGKTTILRCIAGLVKPDAGRIVAAGRVLFDSAAGVNVPIRDRRIGYVFQDHLLFPHLSVEANLRFGAGRRAGTNGAAAGVGGVSFEAVVDVLELGGLRRRRPATLSGGEQQRVALGRALLSQPDLLLMDEPLASLDETLRGRILDYLEKAAVDFGVPILFVSHSQAEVRRLADWVVTLDHGRMSAEGPPADVLSQPAALALRDGSGPVNVLRLDRVEAGANGTMGTVGGLRLFLPGRPAGAAPSRYAAFDPSDVTLAAEDVVGLSARNHLRGVVAVLTPLDDRVLVAVDVGPMLWAEVTRAAAAELRLAVGATVVCLVKTQSIRYL
ncbi:MAG: molybdenum ABC transporter ATP-binding protein [Planctomycetia bacterium]